MLKRAMVVGASSGIGAALVRALTESGYRVAALARSESKLEAVCSQSKGRAFAVVHDVTDLASVRPTFDRCVAELDGLDLIIYCAGVMPRITLDTFDTDVDRQIVDVNVTGAMAWLNCAAERFKRLEAGTICGIGSVAGDRGRVKNPAYCASKAALHTYLEALRNRLSRHGVTVVTIKPGPIATPMTEGLDVPLVIDADTGARAMLRAIEAGSTVAYVPSKWMPIMMVIRSIPSLLFRRLEI